MAIQALLVILAVLLVLLFLGVPISYAIAVSSLTAILSSIDLNVAVLTAAQRTFVGMSKFSLTAIPFFILAGNIMNQGGIANGSICLDTPEDADFAKVEAEMAADADKENKED